MVVRASLLALGLAVGAVLLLSLPACGGGSSTLPYRVPPPADDGEDDGSGGDVGGLDAVAVWTDAGCGACHGADGKGGFGTDLSCYPVDGLDIYLRVADTPHVGGVSVLDDAELEALAAFLDDGCTSSVPTSHLLPQGASAVLHREGLDQASTSCAPCHGANLEGYGTVPSCASCHGGTPGEGLVCGGCHTTARDDGVGDSRRAVMEEFEAASHHLSVDFTEDDCRVCHDQSQHRGGTVRLRDVDDTTRVFELTGNPMSSSSAAASLEAFCLACHDADGADGEAPFSDGETPVVVDATTWLDGSHAGASLTCMGDGTTIGCHGTGHGSSKRALLAPWGGSTDGATGDTTREEEGFCFQCHTDGGTATTDVESDFDMTSHHPVSTTDQGADVSLECASCHDTHLASASALLRDPDDGGVYSGTLNTFCVTCHDGDAPSGVAFSEAPTGSGWDKSSFAGTTHATNLGDDACLDCHFAHGSTEEVLLLAKVVVAGDHERVSGDYELCWDCHDATTILFDRDAFSNLHKKHVIREDAPCATCHDVHAPYDSSERGLISFEIAENGSWGYTYPSGTTLTSAFVATTSGGNCTVKCHGESHDPESYSSSSGGSSLNGGSGSDNGSDDDTGDDDDDDENGSDNDNGGGSDNDNGGGSDNGGGNGNGGGD